MKRIVAFCVVATIGFLAPPRPSLSAEEAAFDPGATVQIAADLLQREHPAKKVLNDDLSKLWLERFVGDLDPARMYFLASDIRTFQQFESRLDDFAQEKDFQFAALVRDRYRTRVKEAVDYAKNCLVAQQNYSIDERCSIEYVEYANSSEDLRERWRLRLKAELLIEKLHGRELGEVQSQFNERYQRLSQQAERMSDERLCDLYLDALVSLYDPHSEYFSPTQLLPFRRHGPYRLQEYRLGLGLQQRNGQWVIRSVNRTLRSSVSERELKGCTLIAIRRLDGTLFDVVDAELDHVNTLISEPTGPLGSDSEVILELFNPASLKRTSISWFRFSAYEE